MLRQLLTVVALGSAASAVFAAEQDCFQARDHQLRIQGCSQIIQRDPNDATAYHNRAFARGLAGDIDNAIVGLLQGHRDRAGKRQRLRQSWSRIRQQRRVHTCGCGSDQSPRIDRQGDGAADGCSPAADWLLAAQPTGAPPPPTGAAKVPKAPKKAVAARKAPTVPPKEKAIPEASSNVVEEPPTSSWWSWLWGNNAGANPAAGKIHQALNWRQRTRSTDDHHRQQHDNEPCNAAPHRRSPLGSSQFLPARLGRRKRHLRLRFPGPKI